MFLVIVYPLFSSDFKVFDRLVIMSMTFYLEATLRNHIDSCNIANRYYMVTAVTNITPPVTNCKHLMLKR